MKKIELLFFVLYFSTCLFLQAQDKPAFSSMDVFALEWASNPQISPDGQRVVYLRRGMDIMTDKRIARLWLINSDGTEHQKLTSKDVNEGNPTWSPDGTRIAFTASTEQGTELFVYWLKTAKVARLSQLDASPKGLAWSPDGKWLAFTMFKKGEELALVTPPKKPKGAEWATPPRVTTRFKHEADGVGKLPPGYTHLFVIPAEGGNARQLTEGNFNHGRKVHWTTDSKALLFSSNLKENWAYDFRNSEIYRLDIATEKIQPLTHRQGPDRSIAVSSSGKIAFTGFDDKVQTYQNAELYVMNADGTQAKILSKDLDRSVEAPLWDAEGNGVYIQYNDKGDTKIAHIDLAGKQTVLTGKVGGTSVARPYSGGSFSVAKNGTIAYTYATPYRPAEVAILKKGAKQQQTITDLNHDILDHRTLGKCEEVWYKSSVDGRAIQGWVVTPPNFDAAKKYPLLVENHGGPIANYGPWFSPEIQLYATGGYVVFYPNPRGSTSYGEEFGNLLYHNYPGDDYHDVMDGVDELLKRNYLTEDSLFVTGGSAGGIMTAWMIGKNNRFRSAAVIKPVMNWISKTLVADNYYGYANSRYPGQPWENMEAYWKFSPISLVGNIETPTLVMVGSSDMRTPLSESKQLYHALKLRQIETALVEVPGAYHFIANRPSQLITKVEHILAWFEKTKE